MKNITFAFLLAATATLSAAACGDSESDSGDDGDKGGSSGSGGAMPGGGAPDPRAMVARLADRLKTDPNDALGWVRLIRAYVVLGEMDKAREALASARAAFKDNKDALTAFSTIAKDIK